MKVDIKKDIKVNSMQIPWHWHEELEFTYIVKGKKQVLTTGHTYEFQEGEAFFTNSNALCAMKNLGKCKIESHLFHAAFCQDIFGVSMKQNI